MIPSLSTEMIMIVVYDRNDDDCDNVREVNVCCLSTRVGGVGAQQMKFNLKFDLREI